MASQYSRHVIRIAIGGANLGRVTNKNTTWELLMDRLSKPVVTRETFRAYMKLPTEEQDRLKNVGGYWLAGYCKDGRRALANIEHRDLVTLDCDDAPPGFVESLTLGINPLCQYEFALHTTRKHTDEKPRVRIVIPLAQRIERDKYMPLSRILASILDPSMDTIDDVSFRPAQMMYWPSHSADSEFVFHHNPGELCDGEAILEGFPGWEDFTKLPFSEKQGQKRPSAKKAEDPTTKPGLIGAFCRAYDIQSAIEKFIPDAYVPGDDHWGKPRYTYAKGSTTNGAVVEDGGLFLYSHHTSDPCSDRLVNAFDMVRLHLYGDQDPTDTEGKKPTSLPSYKAMVKLASNDEATIAEYNTRLAEAFDDLGSDEEAEADESTVETPEAEPAFDSDIEDLIGRPGTKPRKKLTPLERMNAKHAVARIGGDTVYLTFGRGRKVDYGSLGDLNAYYANVPMPTPAGGREPLSAWWNKQPGRRTYPGGVVFKPGVAPVTAYNLWSGWSVEPDPKASCKRFLDHLWEIVCRKDQAAYDYQIGFWAHMVQRPWEKPGVALVLRGVKGAGKDTVADYIGKLFPNHHVTISQMEHLTGKFNAHHERALLLHVQEGYWAGNPQGVGALNRLITAETTMIERKGIDPIEMPSVVRIFITSNEDWVVPATAGERRYAVYDVSPVKAQNQDYFRALIEERDNGGLAALLHFLQNYDLTGFDIRTPPNTEGLSNQKIIGLKNVDSWWHDLLAQAELPATDVFEDEPPEWRKSYVTVPSKALYAHYREWMREHNFQGQIMIEEHFARRLVAMCPEAKKAQKGSKKQRQWVRIFPTLYQCRQAFATWLGSPVAWFEDEEEEDLIG
jgi:hypothetical protein